MESMDSHNNMVLQPLDAEAVQEPSPEPVKSAVNAEFPLVARLTQGLEECNWEQLQEKYTDAMDEHSRVEGDLRVETAKLLEVRSPHDVYLYNSDAWKFRYSWHGLRQLCYRMNNGP
jgi:hypothetical protein